MPLRNLIRAGKWTASSGRFEMGSADLQAGTQEPLGRDPTAPNDEQADISALREENARLRKLVIQLSKLVIKNVVEHK
jgi:hypothetical protein